MRTIKTLLPVALFFFLPYCARAEASPVATTSFRFCSVSAQDHGESASFWGPTLLLGGLGLAALRRRR